MREVRWVLRLQAFRYTVVYGKGKSNIADALSHLSIKTERIPNEDDTEYIG